MLDERSEQIKVIKVKKLKGTKQVQSKKELLLLDGSSNKINYKKVTN